MVNAVHGVSCIDCGYPKAGLKGKPCPECGSEREQRVEVPSGGGWMWLLPVGVLLTPIVLWMVAASKADPFAFLLPILIGLFAWPIGAIDVIARSGMFRSLKPTNVLCALVVVAGLTISVLWIFEDQLLR